MVAGFAGRLKGAMFAAGLDSPEQLAKIAGISEKEARRLMGLERATLPADLAHVIARALHVRLSWLVADEGPVPFNADVVAAFDLLDKLSERETKRWLAYGRSLVRRST